MANLPLKPLHPESSLVASKIYEFNRISTEILAKSLLPGQEASLKTRPDGTILDGHHRITVLKSRGVDVDILPREIIVRE